MVPPDEDNRTPPDGGERQGQMGTGDIVGREATRKVRYNGETWTVDEGDRIVNPGRHEGERVDILYWMKELTEDGGEEVFDDEDGDDDYDTLSYGQGAGAHFGAGMFRDGAGDDRYQQRLVPAGSSRRAGISPGATTTTSARRSLRIWSTRRTRSPAR